MCHESQKLLYYGKYYRQTVAEWGKWLGVSAGCELQSDVYGPSCGICEKETYQKTVGTLTYSDYKGAGNQYINGDKCVVENKEQVRRLTPLECERLQGFPDGWTDIPGASDNARYRALGNSVAIPCVDFVLRRIACFLQKNRELDENGDFEGV